MKGFHYEGYEGITEEVHMAYVSGFDNYISFGYSPDNTYELIIPLEDMYKDVDEISYRCEGGHIGASRDIIRVPLVYLPERTLTSNYRDSSTGNPLPVWAAKRVLWYFYNPFLSSIGTRKNIVLDDNFKEDFLQYVYDHPQERLEWTYDRIVSKIEYSVVNNIVIGKFKESL